MNIFNPPPIYDSPVEVFESRDREYPFATDKSHFIEYRTYLQNFSTYVEQEVSTAPVLDGMYFVSQQILERFGSMVRFRAAYATLPQSRKEPSTFAYEFPGFFGTDRVPFTKSVNAEVTYDYFPTGPLGAGIDTIPEVEGQRYLRSGHPTKWLSDQSPGTLPPSNPTATTYSDWIANEVAIVAEDSSREMYIGGIVERRTIKIIAQ